MVGKSVTGNCKENKNCSNSNSSTLICALEDCSAGSGFLGTTSAEETVFGIDWLCEEILKYVIYDNSGKISRKMVKNARLVQKIWLQAVTNLLRKLEEPLITLAADGNAEYPTEKGVQRIDQLVETFGTCERLPESFLPVKLNLKLKFFRERNYQSLSDCFTLLGDDLEELELEYPKSGATMPSIFPPFELPHLRKLSFKFSDEALKGLNDDDDGVADNGNGLWLLQTILNASKNLQNFVIPYSKSPRAIPTDLKYLRLPVRISVLQLHVKLTSKDLESVLILRNQLRNLTHFTLQLHEKPFEDRLLFRILERFQKSLQTFTIHGLKTDGHPRPHLFLQFPCMQKLKKIKLVSTECELGPANTLALQRYFPGLKVAKFHSQIEARFVKWIENSKFENVEDLCVSLVNDRLYSAHERYFVSPSYEIMTQLHQAFPNVSSLAISFNICDLTGLKFLFRNMVQLQNLIMNLFGNQAVLDNSSDLIDSILLGLPLWMVEGLKKDQKSNLNWESIFKGFDEPSIRNLLELRTLSLWTYSEPRNNAGLEPRSLISDLLFQHSFMRMTKLRKLDCFGKFQPSLRMQQEWKREGRLINYRPKFQFVVRILTVFKLNLFNGSFS